MKRFFAAATLAAFSLALTPDAFAAPGPNLPILGGPGAIAAGVFVPTSGASKDLGGSTQLSVEFRYTIPLVGDILSLAVPTQTVITAGVQTGSKSGGRSTIIPITVGQLFSPRGSSPTSGKSLFFGGGIGAYIINHDGNGSIIGRTTTKVGGFGELGYNLTQFLFVDAKYQFVSEANGLTANVGLRF